ncbi:hypothetical protein G3I59_47210 [Amycolatopsis rubida]|uniref:PH domain-containing protein n=1 Tax=Amycolatopsis rubida TaxID=112413 RepID=A0ABX0C5E8_9PSEU|nr:MULTISPECIES: hypothetical protein [Amycolatopsis]MYW98000.1 hypothetical protein [Amycolatopsis rubida]NEC62985.1 hypothetical protein [Amycolatopsis rubida]OAP24486.1 hypothetical protein A4R44_04877 [Amycolatopsis sp. M39]
MRPGPGPVGDGPVPGRAGPFRPPAILRVVGWTIAAVSLFLLVCGILIAAGVLHGGQTDRGQAVMVAVSGGALLAVGLLIAVKSSVELYLERSSLHYRKNLFVRGSMNYHELVSIKLQPGPAQSTTIRDLHGRTVAINAYRVDWEPITTWAADHDRTDIFVGWE